MLIVRLINLFIHNKFSVYTTQVDIFVLYILYTRVPVYLYTSGETPVPVALSVPGCAGIACNPSQSPFSYTN